MAPTLVRAPFHRPGWVYEEKVDGWRILAYKDRAGVRLLSRNGVDHTRRFRELAAAILALSPATLVLDGEVAVFDSQLRSRFEWLRDRPRSRRCRCSSRLTCSTTADIHAFYWFML
jgi:bifunctional non-homologous end joining protein LigD